jgi:hypothetical protein
MDGVELQQKYKLPDENVGCTKFLVTTRRWNFLMPPRAHRSFPSLPLAEPQRNVASLPGPSFLCGRLWRFHRGRGEEWRWSSGEYTFWGASAQVLVG